LGREVATLIDEKKEAGEYSIRWDVPQSGIPSGVYYYRLLTETFSDTKKLLIIR
ncbi:MAG: hypothetical protein HYZ33_00565, partial [Ignavibacteriales bacterium]|nr:hypothetical protein [Ignavibacteriales bacterium]